MGGNCKSVSRQRTVKPRRLNDQTFSSNIVLNEAAKRSNIVRRTKCWMKMFELDQTFPSNILRHEQCVSFSRPIQHLPHPTRRWMKMFDRLSGALARLRTSKMCWSHLTSSLCAYNRILTVLSDFRKE